jgi:hypothetical protein
LGFCLTLPFMSDLPNPHHEYSPSPARGPMWSPYRWHATLLLGLATLAWEPVALRFGGPWPRALVVAYWVGFFAIAVATVTHGLRVNKLSRQGGINWSLIKAEEKSESDRSHDQQVE